MKPIGHNPWQGDIPLLGARYPGPAPHPSEVLGYSVGTRAAHHHEILRYFEALAEAVPGRVCLTDYGRTWEDRRLAYLTVSSEDHLSCRATIEARLRSLGDSREMAGVDVDGVRGLPAVCWLSHSLHGDELSGSDAAMWLAYRLAAAEDPQTRMLRQNLLVHIDPVANPDGRERYLATVRAQGGLVPRTDPQDMAHTGCWPWGRTNHYLFDLNRDGVALTQPESRARSAALRQVSPQLVVEVHEMASDDTFLFAAPAEPINPHVPGHVHAWWQRFATDLGAAFGSRRASFYTRGWNEVFYPGYADIWPAYHGAVPVLLEQSTTAGSSVEQPSGRVVSYADCIAAHLAAELSNLTTAADGREQLLADWVAFRRQAPPGNGSICGYLIRTESAPERTARLVDVLLAHGVDLWHRNSDPDEYLVRVDQPLASLIRNLLDASTPLPQSFQEEERSRLRSGGSSRLYDVTAWALPLAFDVAVEPVDKLPEGEWLRLATTPAYRSETPQSRDEPVDEASHYVFRDACGKLTAQLLAAGVRLRLASEQFVVDGERYAAGTLIARAQDNTGPIGARLSEGTASSGIPIRAIESSLSQHGADLGCRSFHLLCSARTAVLTGPGTDPSSYGAIWQLFDRELQLPFTAIELQRIRSVRLAYYDVLIVPELAGDSDYAKTLADAADLLRAWVELGGTLICIGSSALMLAGKASGLTRTRCRREVEGITQQLQRESMPSGAYLHADMSSLHWLSYGASKRLPVLFRGSDSLCAPDDVEVPARFTSAADLLCSGLLWPDAAVHIAGTAWLVRERRGQGQIILFASDPLFRGYSLATQRLFVNAVLFGHSMLGQA